ncbi:MAG TPA: hypothetical protein HA257_00685 [Candidatus Methanoperedenaceae archaeon]|nr:hypothetical protein [Candidatus Methanoperedenaceae archaeon]
MHRHDVDNVAHALELSGFGDITIEVINRGVPVPAEWVREHIITIGKLLRSEDKSQKELGRRYIASVETDGEELLPAVQFTARKQKKF